MYLRDMARPTLIQRLESFKGRKTKKRFETEALLRAATNRQLEQELRDDWQPIGTLSTKIVNEASAKRQKRETRNLLIVLWVLAGAICFAGYAIRVMK